jgi:hypothetical protein
MSTPLQNPHSTGIVPQNAWRSREASHLLGGSTTRTLVDLIPPAKSPSKKTGSENAHGSPLGSPRYLWIVESCLRNLASAWAI